MSESDKKIDMLFESTPERYAREDRRRARLALWLLPLYIAAGVAIGSGLSDVFDAGLRWPFLKLTVGFLVFMGLSWIVPELQRRMRESGEGKQ